MTGARGFPELALRGGEGESLRPGKGRLGGPGRAGQYLQVGDGGVQPVQPGPDHGAGIDATQLLPDGEEESAGPLQVVQEQDHTVVTHCGQGAGGRGVRGGPEATRESWGRRARSGSLGVTEMERGTELG